MSKYAPNKEAMNGRRRHARAFPFRAIVDQYPDPTRRIVVTIEKLECGHVMQRPLNRDLTERLSKTGRRRCRECYQEGRS